MPPVLAKLLRVIVPQRLRLRVWLVRNAFTPYARDLRRAQPTRRERLRARRAIARAKLRGSGGLDRLPPIMVINLASRPDRLAAVTEELRGIGVADFARVDGVTHEDPHIGCSRSHVACVERMLEEDWEAVMICEDDVHFLVPREELDVLVDAFLDDPAAEGACFAYFVSASEPHSVLFRRGTAIQTCACYLVKRSVAADLVALWREGIEALEHGARPHDAMCDRIWARLQAERVFLVPMERAARQAAGYSDIEQRFVTYTH